MYLFLFIGPNFNSKLHLKVYWLFFNEIKILKEYIYHYCQCLEKKTHSSAILQIFRFFLETNITYLMNMTSPNSILDSPVKFYRQIFEIIIIFVRLATERLVLKLYWLNNALIFCSILLEFSKKTHWAVVAKTDGW